MDIKPEDKNINSIELLLGLVVNGSKNKNSEINIAGEHIPTDKSISLNISISLKNSIS